MSKPFYRWRSFGAKTINVLIIFSFTFAPLSSAFAQDTGTSSDTVKSDTSSSSGNVEGQVTDESSNNDSGSSNDQSVTSMFESSLGGSSGVDSGDTSSVSEETANDESSLNSVHQPNSLLSGGDPGTPTTQAPNLFSYQSIKPQVDHNSGALIEKIPVEIPPGRSGLQPDISLQYNSQQLQDDSIVGYGWSLPIPYIERMNKRGTDNLYTDNYYYSSVSGELATTTATTSPNEYYARVDDGSFIKYLLSTSTNNSWIAYDKNGTKYTYGAASSTQQYDSGGDPTKVYRWMLQEVRDTNDNYITYAYTRDQNQLYPDTITYTGHASTDGLMVISFTLASSTIPYTTYKSAFKISTNKQVSQIQASINGTWVRRYNLTYGVGANGFRPLLTYIQESGRDLNGGEITLPSTGFSYASSTVSFTNNSSNRGYAISGQGYIAIPTTDNGLNDDALFRTNGFSGAKEGFINGDSLGTVPETWAIDTISAEYGTRFLDVNGDGIPDLVRGYIDASNSSNSTSTIRLNISTTTGSYNTWYQIATSSVVGTIPTFGYTNGTTVTGGLLGNLNGDGLPDYTTSQSDIGSNTSYLGNGRGWTSTSNFVPVKAMPNTSGANASLNSQMVDINGDGLDDWMWSDSSNTYFCLNQGTSWDSGCASAWTLATSTLWNKGAGVYVDRGMRFMDVNGDGLPDFLRSYDGTSLNPGTGCEGGSVAQLFLNTGSGWATSTVTGLGYPITSPNSICSQFSQQELADWNGDGLPDQFTYYNQASKEDVLTKITYPKGGNTQITYKMTPQVSTSTNPHLPTPILVVTRLVTNDKEGHDTQYDYAYTGGKLYLANGPIDRKFAGFSTITETGPLAVTKTYFSQGDTASTTVGERTDGFGQMNHSYREDVSSLTGTLLKRNFYQWDSTDLGNNRFLTVLGRQLRQDFDSSGVVHKDRALVYQYATTTGNLLETDDYGEVVGSSDGTYTDTGSDTRVASSTYAQNSSINLSVPTATTQYMASSTKVKETKYTYDNLSYGSVTSGNVTKQENWISGSSYASTTKAYNTYGLIASSTDPNGNQTSYSYDSYNFYPATVTNALNQATNYTYDYPTGKVVQKTDPNTFVTKNIYDAVGRLSEVDEPDLSSPSSLVPRQSISYTDNVFPSYTSTTNYLTSATSSTNYEYFDGLGRTIQKRNQAGGINIYTVQDNVYDPNGLVNKSSLPYFDFNSSYTSATTTAALLTTFTYDSLGRPTLIVNAVGTTTDAYGAWNNSKTNQNGNTTQYIDDPWGNLVNVVEPLSTTTATTTYAYDVVNNLTKITDALGNVRNFTYDGLGRVLTSEDLHAVADGTFGSSTYTYDPAGNVSSRLDPNGKTIQYTYDSLNRSLTEDDTGQAGTEATNTYDSCTNGIGYLCIASTTSARIANTYNALALVASTTNTVSGSGFGTVYSYDRQGNVIEAVYPDGNDIKYGLDAMGRVQSITNKVPGGSVFSPVINNTEYAPTGQVSLRAYANGLYSQYIYDPNRIYRLSAIVTATTTSVRTVTSVTSNTTSSTTVASTTLDLLVVGGGGGGGQVQAGTPAGGGGGGAGGLIIATSSIISGNTYTVTVGAGGAANSNGANSSALGFTAVGGGAGSSYNGSSFFAASSGGSGGGGMAQNNNGASGTSGQGNSGGNGANSHGGGGGGGAGGAGANENGSGGGGNGGSGTSSSISGASVTYAGGGGGGARNGFGSGGSGGASSAGSGGTNGSAGGSASNNSGSGGGGASAINSGGSGGSGIVIFSAPSGVVTASTTATHTTSGGKDIWTFTSSGTLSLNATTTYATTYATSTYTVTAASSSNPIQAITYTYDSVGNITNMYDVSSTTATKVVDFTYDPLNRLLTASTTAASSTPYTQTYTYNAIGNITNIATSSGSSAYTYAGSSYTNPNAPTSIAANTLTYDQAGNVLTYAGNAYTWDWRNRMTQSALNGAGTTTYAYDSQDARVKQAVGSTTTIYPNRAYSIVSNVNGATTTATSTDYLWEGDTLVATIDQAFINGTATGTPVTRYYHPDHLGSTNVVTDSNGNLVQTLDYYPYGATRINTQVNNSNVLRQFIGQFTDSSNLSYLNARYYDSSRGQFLSQDPMFIGDPRQQNLMNPQSLNSYSYAEGNPITNSDPSGLLSAKGVIQSLIQSTFNLANGISTVVQSIGRNPVQTYNSVSQGVTSAINNPVGTAKSVANSVVTNTINNASQTYADITSGNDARQNQGVANGLIFIGSLVGGPEAAGAKGFGDTLISQGPASLGTHALDQMAKRNISMDQFHNVVQNGEVFPYYHDGADKIGYYNPQTGIFAGQAVKSGKFTTVINDVTSRYIQNLKNNLKP